MARYVHYLCPDCGETFKHFHHPTDAPPPDRCPLCNAWVSADAPPQEVFVPQAPLIRENAYAKSIDKVYREQEQASSDRADEAYSSLEDVYNSQPKVEGPEADLVAYAQKLELAGLKSGLKITDMRDPSSMREGDTSITTSTPASLTTGGSTAGFQNLGGAIPNHAPGIPLTGENARQQLTASHGQRVQAMTSRGQMAPTFIDRN